MEIRLGFWICLAASLLAASAHASATVDNQEYRDCISAPQAPGYHWPQDVIAAFCADGSTDHPTYDDIRLLIESGQARALDARLQALLDDYYDGMAPEGAVFETLYGNFNWGDPGTAKMVHRWLEQSPRSAFAYSARGIHRMRAAFDTRGGEFWDKTPPEKIRGMMRQVPAAKQDLAQAALLNPKLFTTFIGMLHVARMSGDEELGTAAMKGMMRVDPANYYVRVARMIYLQPRWHGSLDEMDQLANSAQRWRSTNPRLVSLQAIARAERAWFPAMKDNDSGELAELERALAIAPSFDHLRGAADLASRLGQHQRSVELYTQRLRFWPGNEYARARRARGYVALEKPDLARADLQHVLAHSPSDAHAIREVAYVQLELEDKKAALSTLELAHRTDAKDFWTLRQLAWLYLYDERQPKKAEPLVTEMLRQQPQSGAAWLMRADVIQNLKLGGLREAVDNFVRYADATDADQAKALPKVKAWLAKQDRNRK